MQSQLYNLTEIETFSFDYNALNVCSGMHKCSMLVRWFLCVFFLVKRDEHICPNNEIVEMIFICVLPVRFSFCHDICKSLGNVLTKKKCKIQTIYKYEPY